MKVLEALGKAMKLCSTKEYAPFEIEQKLSGWGLEEDAISEVINTLKEEKFLDEFRMARYFANDKLKFNKWGKIKIRIMLQQKKVLPEAISEALDQSWQKNAKPLRILMSTILRQNYFSSPQVEDLREI